MPKSFVFCKRLAHVSARPMVMVALLTALTACSWFSSDNGPDTGAKVLPPLEIPPDLVTPEGDPRLARPELPEVKPTAQPSKAATAAADCRCSEPPRIGERVLPAGKGVQRMREGSRRWLVVQAEPEQVWPLARKFLDMRGYRVQRDEPAIGLLESDWKNRYADGEAKTDDAQANWRERLSIRIEPAEKAGYTEIYMTQRQSQRVSVAGADTAQAQWELRPADEERAVEMLNRLAKYLAAEEVTDAVPLQPLKASIAVNADGHTVIKVEASFEKVWRRTSAALDALGF